MRLALAVATVAALVSVPAAASPGVAAGCGEGSWTAGTVELCSGTLVYRDYVYDDHGATASDAVRGRLEGMYYYRPGGDAFGDIGTAGMADQYRLAPPRQLARDNLADLVSLRLRLHGDRVVVTAELNTVLAPDDAVVVVGLDTDVDAATEASPTWPLGLIASPFLPTGQQALTNTGNDVFLALTRADPRTNLLTGSLPTPAGSRWRVQAVTAIQPDGEPGPVVMNVAFRGVDERGGWWDTAQALALAANDISGLTATVPVADLRRQVTRRTAVTPGLTRQRVYVSRHLPGRGEGVDHAGVPGPDGDHAFTLLGRYQPYGFFQPPTPGPHGLQLTLHGLGENHAFLLTDPLNSRNPTNYARRFGIEQDRLLASPLARGPRGWYSSYAERDVLDVLADVRAHFPVDDDAVVLSGLSMGGYGATRLGALHPDLFAAVIDWVGPSGASTTERAASAGSSAVGSRLNVLDVLGNLRNTPFAGLYHGTDQLVHVDQALAFRSRLAELRVPSMHWLHPIGPHSSDANYDDWQKEANWSARRVRATNPAHVSFRTDRRFFHPQLGIAPDRAYWLFGITPAAEEYADVDAVSHACPGEPVRGLAESTGVGPSPWVAQEVRTEGVVARPRANRVDLTARNVAALRIDVARACLDDGPVEIRSTVDRAVRLTLSTGRGVTLPKGTARTVVR